MAPLLATFSVLGQTPGRYLYDPSPQIPRIGSLGHYNLAVAEEILLETRTVQKMASTVSLGSVVQLTELSLAGLGGREGSDFG